MEEVLVLRWLHIIAMVYWLGGEWGVFQTSYNVINRNLSLEERRRHMETAYRIDILARTGIITLLPLGLHMGHIYGLQPYGGSFLTGMWIFVADEGMRWYAWKFTLYGFALCIGLGLRWIMRAWTTRFRQLAEGPNPAAEAALEREIGWGRMLAYIYWIAISGICFLGTVKPL
ncbi:MAG: hypothetical protein LW689_10305 [Novosphingobium sp.]|nr:hypothetical protein [Novosphingobium sp.]